MNLDAGTLAGGLPALPPQLTSREENGIAEQSSIGSDRMRAVSDDVAAGVYTNLVFSDEQSSRVALVSSRVALHLSSSDAVDELAAMIEAAIQVGGSAGEAVDPPGEPASGVWDDAVRFDNSLNFGPNSDSTSILLRVGPALGTIFLMRTDGTSTAEASMALASLLAERMRSVLTDLGAFEQ